MNDVTTDLAGSDLTAVPRSVNHRFYALCSLCELVEMR